MPRTLKEAIYELTQGIQLDGCSIHPLHITPGRFQEEENIQIAMMSKSNDSYFLCAKVFYGRPPSYSPWVELYNIEERVICNRQTTSYFDSHIEDFILQHFITSLSPGARIFVEYYNDPETKAMLGMGCPPVLTRLGNKMFRHGCTWFKDWYFPEGYLEGNQKLQGEKPLNTEAKARQLKAARDEVMDFRERTRIQNYTGEFIRRALTRMASVMTELRP